MILLCHASHDNIVVTAKNYNGLVSYLLQIFVDIFLKFTYIFHYVHFSYTAVSITCILQLLHFPLPTFSHTLIFHYLHFPFSLYLHFPLPAISITCLYQLITAIFHYVHFPLPANSASPYLIPKIYK